MPKVELPFEALLEATGQLDAAQLEALLQRATAHHQKKQQEESLLKIWEEPPIAPEHRSRLEELLQLLEEGQISEPERQELLNRDEQAMQAQARRLQAVIDLAHLRGIEPGVLLDQLQPRTA